ncbi:unnamed protein product [Polarella glacialis]|uniref:Uncharacterized protein n=1 Tax=Polarella glacialis TaxID=89957 RepID=A0A813J4S9_POLGL|nr:unnamed protein product [Polarella glacialis]CAE8673278.1 unnamed protein product [Polarella glacialis]
MTGFVEELRLCAKRSATGAGGAPCLLSRPRLDGMPERCSPFLGRSLEDAWLALSVYVRGSAQPPRGASLFDRLYAMIQQQNTHLWQLAAAFASVQARKMPQIRFDVGGLLVNDDRGELRSHTLARMLKNRFLLSDEGHRGVYVEVGIWTGNTSHHLAQVALPYLSEMHLVENDVEVLQYAGQRVARQTSSNGWTTCVQRKQVEPWNHGWKPAGSTLRPSPKSLFTCADPPERVTGSIFLHPVNGSLAAGRFGQGSVDLVFIDSMGVFKSLMTDMEHYWRALRKGGILAGHDFYHVHSALRPYNDVIGVALAFAARHDRELFLSRDATFWMVK